MYVVYFRAYIILRAHATLSRGALLSFATFATFATLSACFWSKAFIHAFAVPFALLPFCLSCVPSLRSLRTFCRSFVLKRFQRSFYTVCRAVLSGLIVWRVYLHRLHRLARLNSLICGKFAVLGEYRGAPPKPKRREAQLRSHRNLYFLFPKIFFLKNPLSPSASCPFQCQKPVFLDPFRVCVPKKPPKSQNLLKETPF